MRSRSAIVWRVVLHIIVRSKKIDLSHWMASRATLRAASTYQPGSRGSRCGREPSTIRPARLPTVDNAHVHMCFGPSL